MLLLPVILGTCLVCVQTFQFTVFQRPPRRNVACMSYERVGNKIVFGEKTYIEHKFVDKNPKNFAEFMKEPKMIITASWSEDVMQLSPNLFRLSPKKPFDFAGVAEFDFSVDVAVETKSDGRVVLSSRSMTTQARFRNSPPRPVPLSINIRGELVQLMTKPSETHFQGLVSFEVTGPLEGPLAFLPDVVLRTTTSAINKLVLSFARRDFIEGIQRNYRTWSAVKL